MILPTVKEAFALVTKLVAGRTSRLSVDADGNLWVRGALMPTAPSAAITFLPSTTLPAAGAPLGGAVEDAVAPAGATRARYYVGYLPDGANTGTPGVTWAAYVGPQAGGNVYPYGTGGATSGFAVDVPVYEGCVVAMSLAESSVDKDHPGTVFGELVFF